MKILLNKFASQNEIADLVTVLDAHKLFFNVDQSSPVTTISIVGDPQVMTELKLENLEFVENIEPIRVSYKLVSREFRQDDTIVDVNGVKIGGDEPFITMAGPCSIETEAQIFECARIAAEGGAKILRGGAFKPRTSPYAFQGLEELGLKYMRKAADKYHLQVITEVMDEAHLDMVTHYTDIIQVGARNMQNFKLLQAIGKTKMPVALKRGIAGTIDEWLNAAEYIAAEGNMNIIFVERGIRTYETATRNTLDLSAVPVIQKLSHFPIIVDPSHGVGIREFIEPLALASEAVGASGMIVEIHPNPEEAWSDGQQTLNELEFKQMMKKLAVIEEAILKIKEI